MNQPVEKRKYYRSSWNDLKNSEGWFGKICLLGLLKFVPVFGSMTLYGYAYEWSHELAWGVNKPLPKKIFGRDGSKMLRWGFFALVIFVVFALVPYIIQAIGVSVSASNAVSVFTYRGRVTTVGNPGLNAFGSLLAFIGLAATIFINMFAWVGIMRMTMYDKISTGFQLGKIWAMAKKDFGGLLRILGMSLLLTLIGGAIITALVFFIAILGTIFAVATFTPVYVSGVSTAAAYWPMLISACMLLLPLLFVVVYASLVLYSFIELLVARALGYWMQQFDVAQWGSKDDPLPFQKSGAAQQTAAPQQPVPPAGSPDQSAAATAPGVNAEPVAQAAPTPQAAPAAVPTAAPEPQAAPVPPAAQAAAPQTAPVPPAAAVSEPAAPPTGSPIQTVNGTPQ